MSPEKPLVYVILGATGSGRREVIVDLLEAGLFMKEAAASAVLVAAEERASDADARLFRRTSWELRDGMIAGEVPEGATHVFFLTDGRVNPIDQLEALKPWMAAAGAELGRIISVVNCRLAEANPSLLAWYDACIHFSDVVLLHQREGVANKWLSDFRARYERKFYPCVFELVKGGRIKNPALVLEPQARRMSHYFEEEAEWVVDGMTEGADEDELKEGEVTAAPAMDPYLERRPGGRRVLELPDIARFLDQPA